MPAVSVILPTYERRDVVGDAINSVLAQSFSDFELIVVDDGSTDGTGESLQRLDPRVRYVWQANAGVAAARNRGLELARAPIAAFIDSDDVWLPDHLAVVVEMLMRAPEAVFATTRPDRFLGGAGHPRDAQLCDPRDGVLACGRQAGFLSCIAVRSTALAGVDGFDERLRAYEDRDLQLRLATLGPYALLRRRTVLRGKRPDSLRERAQLEGDYLRGAELSARNLLMAAERAAGPLRPQLRREAEGALRLAQAMTALDQGADDTSIAPGLAAAARLLPAGEQPRLVANAIKVHLPGGLEPATRLDAMRQVLRLWPDRRSDTARYLRVLAIGSALRLGRPGEAARLAAGWPWRGSLRAAPRVARVVGERSRRVVDDGQRVRAGGPGPAVRALMLRTERGPLRPLWALAHRLATRAVAAYLRGGDGRLSVYLRGSLAEGDPVYGFADVDLAFVVPSRSSGARETVERRWRRLRRWLPGGAGALLDVPEVYVEDDLVAWMRSPPFTHGCRSTAPTSRERQRWARGAERSLVPELAGSWRLLAGPERRPSLPARHAGERRMVAWLELQYWWLHCFRTCAGLDPASARYMCAKLLTEPARTWLWLVRGERFRSRRALIRSAARELPEEAAALDLALRLLGSLDRSAEAPLGAAVDSMVRVSRRIAAELDRAAGGAGATEVRLVDGGRDRLAFPASSLTRLRAAVGARPDEDPLPLVDWRARVWSFPPDECFFPSHEHAPDPARIASAANGAERGAYAALVLEDLMLLPAVGKIRLRGVQTAATDPVSFALVRGEPTAAFPEVDGWSAGDCARRAVAEHLGWLRDGGRREDPVDELGRLFSAARAACFAASVRAGDPALHLTAAATAEHLAGIVPGRARAVTRAYDVYRAARQEGTAPDRGATASLREVVAALPAYAAQAPQAGSPTKR
jgi:hypothetical protein